MMENCKYQVIPNTYDSSAQGNVRWLPFLRQLFVTSGVLLGMFLQGVNVGAPTVYIPQARTEASFNGTITDDVVSWLTSSINFSGAICTVIMCISIKFVGRKPLFMFGVAELVITYIVLYYSSNVTHLLISTIMQGFAAACQMVVGVLIITEYSSPKYRGLFITMKCATFYWGVWTSNAIGTFFHWKIIPLFGIGCGTFVLLTSIVWPDSPYWFISQGKYRECAAAHRWLKGCNEDAEKELEDLFNSQREYLARYEGKKMTLTDSIIDNLRMIKSKEFYKPTVLSIGTGQLAVFSGKAICVVYSIDIIKSITNSESAAYIGMLILDGITIVSMYCGCIIARYLKRRTLLLGASSISVMCLCMLSLYLYLIALNIIAQNKYISLLLLTLFSIAVSCGPMLMCLSVYGELIPIRSRNLSVCVISIAGKLLVGLILKMAPLLFRTFHLHGTFLIFAILSAVLIIILYKYLPETKDKTLKEITDIISKSK